MNARLRQSGSKCQKRFYFRRTTENENHSLCHNRGERVVGLEYLRAANRHSIGVIRFHRDCGELLARAQAGASRDGLDSWGRVFDGRRYEWERQLRDADGFE